MNKKTMSIKRIVTVVALVVVALLCVTLFAACNDDDATTPEKCVVKLVAGDGGTLSKSEIEAEVGTTLAKALKGLSPVEKEGFTFAGWYLDGEQVLDQKVPAGSVTLTAKYTVALTVRQYVQGVDLSYGAADTLTLSGIYGEPYAYAPAQEHFAVDSSKDNRLSTDSLGLGEVFTAYLARERYGVTIVSVKADGTEESASFDVVYGAQFTTPALPEEFEVADGRRFLGWTVGEEFKKPGDALEVGSDLTLTAVWDIAYVDRAGGADYVFLPKFEPGVAVLDRAGVEFRGVVDDEGVFTITYQGVTLKGKVNENGTYMYSGAVAAGVYVYYDSHYGVQAPKNEDYTLVVNEYGEGTLTLSDVYTGVCYIDSQLGDYVFAVDEDTAFYFSFGKLEDETLVFTPQSEEYGSYVEFVSSIGFLNGYEGDGIITLDGYGAARYYDSYHDEYYYGYYGIDAQRSWGRVTCINLHMYATDGWLFGEGDNASSGTWKDRTVYCIDLGERIIYVYENVKGEYTDDSGATLTLDGFGGYSSVGNFGGRQDSATYEEGGRRESGSYFVYESDVFGTVVEMTTLSGTRSFALGEDNSFKSLGKGITEYVNLYSDPNNYGRSAFGGAVLVMHERSGGSIPTDVYCEVNWEYTLVGSGTCVVEERGGVYLYTMTVTHREEAADSVQLFTKIAFLVSDLFDANSELHRTYYVFEKNDDKLYTALTGTGKSEGASLWSVDLGYLSQNPLRVGAFYSDGTSVIEGNLTIGKSSDWFDGRDTQYGTFRFPGEDGRWQYKYFAISEDGAHFEQIDSLPYLAYSGDEHHNYWFEDLCLDAQGNAQKAVIGKGENVVGQVSGTYEVVDKTMFGDDVYKFTPEANENDVTEFLFVIEPDYVYRYSYGIAQTLVVYHLKSEEKTYVLADGSTLRTDGYWYKGSYTAGGVELVGLLYTDETDEGGKILVLETDEVSLIFDVQEDGSLTMRDGVDGYYKVLDQNSQNVNSWYVELDGYGNVKVTDGGSYTHFGTYVETEEYGVFDVSFACEDGTDPHSYKMLLLSTSSANAAIIIDSSVRGQYVGNDTSLIYLDGMNVETCYYIDPHGVGHIGDYYLLSDVFGAFSYMDGEDAKVITFTYDKTAKTFVKLDYSQYYGTYYANDLTSAYKIGETVSTDEAAGYLYMEGDNATLYLIGERDGKISAKTGTLKDGVLTLTDRGSEVKYLNLEGQEQTLTGKVTFAGKEYDGLTLSFTPYGATFSVDVKVNGVAVDDLSLDFSGWSLWLNSHYDGWDYDLTIDIDLAAKTFTVSCDYEYEFNNLQSALQQAGITLQQAA